MKYNEGFDREKREKELNYARFHMKNQMTEFAKEIPAEVMLQVLYENTFGLEAVLCNLANCKCSESVNSLYIPDYKKCRVDFDVYKAVAKSSLRLEETGLHEASIA